MTNKEMSHKLMEFFSSDLCCDVDSFLKTENSVVLRKDETKPFFSMLCYGYGAVACVDKSIYDWCRAFLITQKGFRCFDGIQMIAISKQLEKHNYSISCGQEMLPDLTLIRNVAKTNYPIKCFDKATALSLADTDLANFTTISDDTELIVAAFDGQKVIGVSDAKAKGQNICEIGIEVDPDYRRAGIASILTSQITSELLSRSKIPYATTSWSNIASRGVLQRCNFFPVSVRMDSMDIKVAEKILIGDYE